MAVDVDIRAFPTAAIETVPIISLRVNPTQSSDWNSTLHPVSTSRFRSHYHVALLSCAVKSTHPYGNWNSRFFPCLSLSSYADICMARKDFVIVDRLFGLLRATYNLSDVRILTDHNFWGFDVIVKVPRSKYVLVRRNFAVFGVCGVEAVAAKVGVS